MRTAALQRLQMLATTVSNICNISGAPGLSYGAVYGGEILYTLNHGYRDVEAKLPVTSDTIYNIGSLTKAFTAAALGDLVEEGIISWETPISKVMRGQFHTADPSLTDQTTVLDVLSHRTGLQRSNQLWRGSDNVILLGKNQALPHVSYLRPVQPFRTKFLYNNWGYALAGEVIEHASGESYGTYVSRRVLKPLRLDRTYVNNEYGDNNVAKGYTALNDRSFYRLAPVQVQNGTLMAASQGLRSSLNDMLRWAMSLLEAEKGLQSEQNNESPLRQVLQEMTGHIPISTPYRREQTYGMGWARVQLPGPMGALGCNPGFVKKMPLVAKGCHQLVIYHQGSLAGYTSSIFLIPEIEGAIVVLTNSISLNDCADWIGQLALEALLDSPERNDYESLAQESADSHIAKFPAMAKSLEGQRQHGTSLKPLDRYIGKYFNSIGKFFIEIRLSPDSKRLQLAFQGLDSQVWPMEHYHHDTFLWLMSRDDAVKRCRFPYSPEKLYRIAFVGGEDGAMKKLVWAHDGDAPPEEFCKTGGDRSAQGGGPGILEQPLKAILSILAIIVLIKGIRGYLRRYVLPGLDTEKALPKVD